MEVHSSASLVTQLVKNLPAVQENWVWSLGWEDPLQKGTATHSSILAWRIPMDCIIHRVTKSRTWLSNFHFHFCSSTSILGGLQFSSVTQSCPTLLQPQGLQHARLPCPSPTPRACSNSCLSNQWCHPTISFSVIPFSSHLQSFPESGSFPMSQLFTSGGQSIGVSASTSVLP